MAKNRDFSKFPNAITVLDNGNVGIGNTNPYSKLDVRGGGISQTTTDFAAGSAGTVIYMRTGATTGNTTYGLIQVGNTGDNAAGNLVLNQFGGNVGIGTSSPNQKLHIDGASAGLNISGGNNRIYFTGYRALEGAPDGSRLDLGEQYTNIYIPSKVGIGVSSPAFKLDVSEAGSVINGTATIGSNMKGIRIYNSVTATNNSAVGLWFSTGPHQAGIASFRATADTTWETSLAFYTHVDTTSNLTDATEKMRISGQGYVTKPSQPSFYATSTAGQTDYASGEVVVFNTTRHNTGSHYNTSNGRFTAPVSGKYLFSLNLYAYGGYRFSVTLTVNGNQYAVQDLSPLAYHETTVGEMTTGFTIIWELSAGDYIEVRTRVGYTSRIYRAHSHFSGQLLS